MLSVLAKVNHAQWKNSMSVESGRILSDQLALTSMGGLATTHYLDETVGVRLGAIVPDALAQGPALVFSECSADVFLDADLESPLHTATTNSDADVLLTGHGVGDAVDSMIGVLSAASFWGGISHFHNNIIQKWEISVNQKVMLS